MVTAIRVLLTGRPGIGKTTVIRRFLELTAVEAAGFYTAEIRRSGGRTGFSLNLLDGTRHTMASVGISGRNRVGKYGVDLRVVDGVAVPEIERAVREGRMLIVDEIGKMELLSRSFQEALSKAFDSPIPILGTILFRPHPAADRFRDHPGATILETTLDNRDRLPFELARRFGLTVHRSGQADSPGSE